MSRITDKYFTVVSVKPHGSPARRQSAQIMICATYGDHVWGGPSVDVIGYADTYADAVKIRRQARLRIEP